MKMQPLHHSRAQRERNSRVERTRARDVARREPTLH
jgi:hypothetical protein